MKSSKTLTAQLLVIIVVAVVSAWPAHSGNSRVSASEAHELAMRGEITLIDVRAPEEWKKTGIGASAKAVSMHVPGFFEKIKSLTRGDKSKAIAVICAHGGRSGRIQSLLAKRGYRNIIDVPEGMLGSTAGPGWIDSGLPVTDPG